VAGVLLVVGLGNPGIEYQFTPHNAGFLAIDALADEYGATVGNRRCRSLTGKAQIAGREVILAKPETYMNLSGLAVTALVKEFDADPLRDLLVLYDELDLPLGTVRVKERGSPAGHNGARSITGSLGTSDWARIRIGVGPAGGEDAFRRGKDYLLTPLRKADLNVLGDALERTVKAVEMVVARGVGAAMNEINRREPNGSAE
jgi:PTH1 family peptidyl-tRNA hydrolase